jgi:hypothetical protein
MLIEKEYEIILDDYLCLQKYFFQKNRNWWNTNSLVTITLSVFIIFSLQYINDDSVTIMGIIIILLNIIRIIIESISGYKFYNNYLIKNYYKDFKTIHIKIKIDEDNIYEYSNDSELKITKNWITECVNTKDYIYLMNDKHFTLIIPKKYYSNEEQKIIINRFKKI